MKEFSHVNVVPLYGVALVRWQVFVVLPFLQNGDLKTFLTIKVRLLLCVAYLNLFYGYFFIPQVKNPWYIC